MNRYFQIWHNRKREPRTPVSGDEAQRRLAAGEELCVVVDDGGRISCTVEFSPHGGITASILRNDRQAARKIVYERQGRRLFLRQTFDFEYDDNGVCISTVWNVCSEGGDARTETIRRGESTSRVIDAKEDPTARWSDLPTIENLAALFGPDVVIQAPSSKKTESDSK